MGNGCGVGVLGGDVTSVRIAFNIYFCKPNDLKWLSKIKFVLIVIAFSIIDSRGILGRR